MHRRARAMPVGPPATRIARPVRCCAGPERIAMGVPDAERLVFAVVMNYVCVFERQVSTQRRPLWMPWRWPPRG
ncbi:hypothetical protein CBM2634_A130030 [Cupriavidus taiwanensis]|uniref:Uncharacterized protein n=1 Tax=Cupriavidus taiwanensis TaxID=164546 RepID=A0A375IV90_9BURK|nr:hypothetical protein CBM2634_A130030 [Cupriavidus taiwanensis]